MELRLRVAKDQQPINNRPVGAEQILRRALKVLAGPLVILVLLGSGPVRDGTDVSVGAGYRQLEREKHYGSSCDGPSATWRFDDRIADAAFDVRRKEPGGGFVFAAEGEGAFKYVRSGTCSGLCGAFPSDVDHFGFGTHLALRFGYQWDSFGLMGGPAAYYGTMPPLPDGLDGDDPDWVFGLFPSVELWFGNREFHFFLDWLSNMAYHNLTWAKAGLGHVSDEIKAGAGAGAGYLGAVGFADFDKKLADGLWLGVAGGFQLSKGPLFPALFCFEEITVRDRSELRESAPQR